MLRGGEKEGEGGREQQASCQGGRESMKWVDSRVKVRERLRELAVDAVITEHILSMWPQ